MRYCDELPLKSMPLVPSVVGVDAGGTKTRAAFARGDSLLRTAAGPGANATVVGVADAADAILRAIRDASRGEHIDAVYVGAAGAGTPSVAEEIAALLRAAYSDAVVAVGDDVAIALRAAIPRGSGVALVAGTGSIALAVDEAGTMHRAGGLGYLLGDEGSAGWIGLEAIRRLGRVYDGREHDEETSRLVARHFDAADRPSLIAAIYGERVDVARIAALAPSIIAFAGKGNRVSRDIVQRAAVELATLIETVLRRNAVAAKIVLAGGLMSAESILTALLREQIAARIGVVEFVPPGEPLVGAVRCASGLLLR